MKKVILPLLLLFVCLNVFAKTWTVLSSGMTFSPATVTINQGDSVKFTIDASHNAVEVSQTVWNANGSTSNSGFSVPFGGGTVLPAKLAVGTHYYVCTPHASLGMKGKIVVQAATSIAQPQVESGMVVFPNPATDHLNIRLTTAEPATAELSLYDLQGKRLSVLLPETTVDGTYEASFSRPDHLAPGIYFVRLRTATATSYQKVVFQ